MTEDDAAKCLVVIAAAFPTYPVDEETASLYIAAISDLDYETTKRAVETWIRTEARFPKISELVYTVNHLKAPTPALPPPDRPPPAPDAAERFAEMRRRVADAQRRPVDAKFRLRNRPDPE